MRLKKNEFDRQSSAVIDEISQYKSRHGFVADLTREISAISGQKVHRQHVEMWLRNDPRKRVQPLLGAGLVLIQAFNRVKAKEFQRDKQPKKKGQE